MSTAKKIDTFFEFAGSEELHQDLLNKVSGVNAQIGVDVLSTHNGEHVALLESSERSDLFDFISKNQSIKSVIGSAGRFYNTELAAALRFSSSRQPLIDYPISSILSPNSFGAQKEKDLTLLRSSFRRGADKNHIEREVERILSFKMKSSSQRTEAVGIVDELITNVIYNAPYVDQNNSSSGVARSSTNVQLDDHRPGQFVLGADADRLVIGCEDRYGSLNLMNMLLRVNDCYRLGIASNMNMGTGGARIGMYMVLNSCSSFYGIVEQGKMTAVYCTFPYRMSNRKRAEEPLNIHFFNI